MKKLVFALLTLSFIGILALPALVSADATNFTVTNFSADETLSRADPQGELRIRERINVTFADFNHGLLRAIPASYKHHSLQLVVNSISSDSAAPIQYTTYDSGGNTVLKIGNPKRVITGAQQYTIDYTLHNVISFYKDHDELYWDANGDQWDQVFDHVSVTLHLPPELRQQREAVCFTGSYGSTASDCTITTSANSVQAATTKPLDSRQGLSYVAGFDTGYFQPAKWYDSIGEHSRQIVEVLIPAGLIGGGSLLYWWRRGRDPRGSGVIIPRYDAPDGLKPVAVGALADFKVDNRDITATIIDLAIHGYFKIIETKHAKRLRKDTLTYILQLQKDDYSQLTAEEVKLMKALFPGAKTGTTIGIATLKNKLYETAKAIDKSVEAGLTEAGYFRSNPLKAGQSLIIVMAVLFIVLYVGSRYLGAWLVAGVIIGGIIAYFCSLNMGARTAKGVAAKEHILGLKLYLETAEKARLEKLQAPDAVYTRNPAMPTKSVDLFEKLLPYAMVLGVEKQWSKQFESLYSSPPDWYSGNWSTFNAYYLASSLSDGIGSAVNTAFTAPSSSGSSGFSGGFSGGGGGGGGGGGW